MPPFFKSPSTSSSLPSPAEDGSPIGPDVVVHGSTPASTGSTQGIDSEAIAALLVERIHSAGMAGPAALVLRVLRPAHWLGGQALHVAQPLLESMGIGARRGSLSTEAIAQFLEREGSVDLLLNRLEEHTGKDEGRNDGT